MFRPANIEDFATFNAYTVFTPDGWNVTAIAFRSEQCNCTWRKYTPDNPAFRISYTERRCGLGPDWASEVVQADWCRVGFYGANPRIGHSWIYNGCNACTNAPTNAHYTNHGGDWYFGGQNDGIPNNCLWACNTGFARVSVDTNPVNDICVPVCAGGVTRLRAGAHSIPLTAQRHTSPAIHVRTGGGVCYAPLVQGRRTGSLNVNVDGTIYHVR